MFIVNIIAVLLLVAVFSGSLDPYLYTIPYISGILKAIGIIDLLSLSAIGFYLMTNQFD
jgi:hypothetical protein